jgi:Uma2 family endonuclease
VARAGETAGAVVPMIVRAARFASRARLDSMEGSEYTAEQAFGLNPPGTWELVEGRFVFMSPAGARHGRIVARVSRALSEQFDRRGLGVVLTGDVGFILRRRPDLVRAPDVAFLRADRVAGGLPSAFIDGPPDLAIEVISPGDRRPDIERKAAEFLAAGTTAVWIIDPDQQVAWIISSGGARALAAGDSLSCPSLFGDFVLALADLW